MLSHVQMRQLGRVHTDAARRVLRHVRIIAQLASRGRIVQVRKARLERLDSRRLRRLELMHKNMSSVGADWKTPS